MKNRILIIVGMVVLALFLGGAAFIGGQLLTGQGFPGLLLGIPGLFQGGSNGGVHAGGVHVHPGDVLPAKELPQTPTDVDGLFDHRQGNSIFIGTGNVQMTIQKDQSGHVTGSASHDGPVVEVVITPQTIFYRDVTMDQYTSQPPAGQKIQQVVEKGSLDEISQYSTLQVWGRKTGDRFIVDVLVYIQP